MKMTIEDISAQLHTGFQRKYILRADGATRVVNSLEVTSPAEVTISVEDFTTQCHITIQVYTPADPAPFTVNSKYDYDSVTSEDVAATNLAAYISAHPDLQATTTFNNVNIVSNFPIRLVRQGGEGAFVNTANIVFPVYG
jgi:hypothetical protein